LLSKITKVSRFCLYTLMRTTVSFLYLQGHRSLVSAFPRMAPGRKFLSDKTVRPFLFLFFFPSIFTFFVISSPFCFLRFPISLPPYIFLSPFFLILAVLITYLSRKCKLTPTCVRYQKQFLPLPNISIFASYDHH
jgi:hypothetical protein